MSKKHLLRDVIQTIVALRTIIQEIDNFNGNTNGLKQLNEAGRIKISILRKKLNHLDELCQDLDEIDFIDDVIIQQKDLSEVIKEFRNANINAMQRLDANDRKYLMAKSFKSEKTTETEGSRDHLIKLHSKITDQLLTVNMQLEQTTKQSFETLDTLLTSSQTIQNTDEELILASNSIQQSGKLLEKFGQREITDKILMYLFTAFFIACVLYVIQKRLF